MLSKDCASEDYEISGPLFCVVIHLKLDFITECPSLKVYFCDSFGHKESVLIYIMLGHCNTSEEESETLVT